MKKQGKLQVEYKMRSGILQFVPRLWRNFLLISYI